MHRVLLICVALLICETLIVTMVVPPNWIDEQIHRERALVRAMIGNAAETSLHMATEATFTTFLDSTGAREAAYRFAIPTAEQRSSSVGLEDFGAPVFRWAAGRLDVFWDVMYRSLYRFTLFWRWLPYCLALLVTSAIDGLMQRKVKQCNFGYSSPIRYNAAVHLLAFALYVIPLYLFLPLAVTPAVVPVWAAGVSLATLLMASNLQKRI